MKEKILSFNSENDQTTENSSEGCLPLSLINNDRRNINRNRLTDTYNCEKKVGAFTKKQSTIDRLEFSNNKDGKENDVSYTTGSFAKYRKEKDVDNIGKI